jgi:hypothetical protein
MIQKDHAEKNRISNAKDLLFIAFHVYLFTQFYNIFGFNFTLWDGVQLILSSILVVGDPLFHSMQPFSVKNNWEDNLEPFIYYVMLIITASRAIMHPKNGSHMNILAALGWMITKALPPPDDLVKLRAWFETPGYLSSVGNFLLIYI